MSGDKFIAQPDSVTVVELDTSLRDGGQSLPEEHQFATGSKPDIAAAIASLGIHTIEAGFPATAGDGEEVAEVARTVGQSEFSIVPKRIVNDELVADAPRVFTPVIMGLTLSKIPDVETTWEAVKDARFPGIHIFLATDERNMRSKHPGMTRRDTLDMFQGAVRHARALGGPDMTLEVSCELASTTDQQWLETVSRSMLADDEARIDVLNLPDTLGRVDHQHVHHMFSEATRWAIEEGRAGDVTISTHNHDDRGRAVDNSIAAIMAVIATARYMGSVIPRVQVEVESGDKLGERNGNANHALFALDLLMSIADGRVPVPVTYIVDTLPTKDVAEYIMEQAKLAVHPRAHATGDWTNKVFSGVHAGAAAKAGEAGIYSPYNAQWFGHEAPMVIGPGKYQGTRGKANIGAVEAYKSEMIVIMQEVTDKAAALGMDLADEATIERIVIAMNTKAVEAKRPIADTEIEAFIAEETGEEIINTVMSHSYTGGTRREETAGDSKNISSHAEVTFKLVDEGVGRVAKLSGTRKGPVDAAVLALNTALDFQGDIDGVVITETESGSGAGAGAFITVTVNGEKFTSYGTGDTIDDASVDAYIKAYNLIERINARKGQPTGNAYLKQQQENDYHPIIEGIV